MTQFWDSVSVLVGAKITAKQVSERGKTVVGQLGENWLAAAIKPVLIAYPNSNIRLDLDLQLTQPMVQNNPGPYDPKKTPVTGNDGYLVITREKNEQAKGRDYQIIRSLILPDQALLSGKSNYTFGRRQSLKRKVLGAVYQEAYRKTPILLETLRTKHHNQTVKKIKLAVNDHTVLRTGLKPLDKPVMWVAMHWLEKGGAEAWAFQQVKLAKAAGFRVIVTADVCSPQRDFAQYSEYADEILLVAQSLGEYDWNSFVLNLVQKYRVNWLHNHHSTMAYVTAHLAKAVGHNLRVEDTTHIYEYNGGFVGASIFWSPAVDLHHVISPRLEKQMIGAGLSESDVVYRPLTCLYPKPKAAPLTELNSRAAKSVSTPLRVGFLGRLAMQKRPLLYIALANKIISAHPQKFTFRMQGSGELDEVVKENLTANKKNKIAYLPWGKVEDFFSQVDVLVVSSDNEGLTLTSLEADQHGVLVVSCDVGSQATVIAPDCLLPVDPRGFLKQGTALLQKLQADPEYYSQQLIRQHKLVEDLRSLESASEFFTQHYQNVTNQA